jgi:glycyl-tRNA synthetase beta chain
MADFLLEIGTDEIPARMLTSATEELARRLRELIARERLATSSEIESFTTPRRIAVLARGLSTSQADTEEQVMGPATKIAYKDGKPAAPAEAFARKYGITVDQIEKIETPKGEYISAKVNNKGRTASEILAEQLPKEIAGIYWAKNMYWRAGKPERFVRPVRWLLALLDDQVVPVEFAGIKATKTSRGHRVLSHGDVSVATPTAYPAALESASVIPTYAAREHRIRKALDAATRTVPGARWREDKSLLDTVVNLTEFPSVILGSFEPEYLTLPEEVLVTVMRDHQKYFAVEDSNGKLAPYFLAVLNTAGDPDGLIRHGNERVLRARFNDARFFWNTDQKICLKQRVEMLKSVTFQKELGSYYEKTLRTQKLASLLDTQLKDAGLGVRPGIVHKAALLAKTDLTTELVKEFTELQGIIGGLYAKAQADAMELQDSTAEAVGNAIYDQYKPESTDDDVPRTLEGAVLATADKADTIAGMFALGLVPSGSKDPFALRRAANGIVRIAAEHKLPISLMETMIWAFSGYAGSEAEKSFHDGEKTAININAFLRERLEFYLKDVKGFAYDVVNAVLASGHDDVVDAVQRAEAVAVVRGSEDFDAISASFKRTKNILRQAIEAGKFDQANAQTAFSAEFDDAQERDLFNIVEELAPKVAALRAKRQYAEALSAISQIRRPLDAFFDHVMVMVEDEQIRRRRLYLLNRLLAEFSGIADFSEIVTEKK